MLPRKDMHPARKALRYTLLCALFLSFAFMSAVVSLRIQYRNERPIKGALQTRLFELDILQHRALTYVNDDEGDMRIAEDLLRGGISSSLYTSAGLTLLEEKSKAGYEPATRRLEQIYVGR